MFVILLQFTYDASAVHLLLLVCHKQIIWVKRK